MSGWLIDANLLLKLTNSVLHLLVVCITRNFKVVSGCSRFSLYTIFSLLANILLYLDAISRSILLSFFQRIGLFGLSFGRRMDDLDVLFDVNLT